jgi:hypothetical protein
MAFRLSLRITAKRTFVQEATTQVPGNWLDSTAITPFVEASLREVKNLSKRGAREVTRVHIDTVLTFFPLLEDYTWVRA